ncbi:MAG: hypothetical protein EU547_01865 [Promethearchaeota archaeon]|nr:MAG: hypothetical protein EU547_01865 [Candidatus Lokiarchaeota archaeon]
MKLCVLNGSPKGNKESITMQYIYYSERLFPKHNFESINIGQILNNMKINDKRFKTIIQQIKSADGIIWCFPIYTTLVPAQLKKFIELLFEQDKNPFQDKYTICLSTSMKFYDMMAHNYMNAVCEDLGLKYVGFYSAHTFDFLEFKYRRKWYTFLDYFLNIIGEQQQITKRYLPIKDREFAYNPEMDSNFKKINNQEKKIVILTDYSNNDTNIAKMIEQFKNCFTEKIIQYNINKENIKGGCLGCLKCGLDNQCVYKDDFCQLFQNIKNSDILVYAGTIKDRFLSSQFKMYFDRCFHNGHTPSMEGMQICFLISGPLSQIANLREWIAAMVELGYANLVDIVTDEYEDSKIIDRLIRNMAKNAVNLNERDYSSPSTFYEVGGYKIFRDMIFGLPGAIFRMDYNFFKEREMFNFPTRDWKGRISRVFLSFLLKSKKIRKKFKSNLPYAMTAAFHKEMNEIDFVNELAQIKQEINV